MPILKIRFPSSERLFTTEAADDLELQIGEQILVEMDKIKEVATILSMKKKKDNQAPEEKFPCKFVKKLTDQDQQRLWQLKNKAREFLPLCEEKIKKQGLTMMKLLNADLSFDEKKLTFYFSAESRVDFRQLVTDLVKTFRKIIRLQQVGSRDEAKFLGGYGRCGREICCLKLLCSSESITLKMAEDQDISLSSSKISGLCGRLMCCLAFELEEYRTLSKKMPEIGQILDSKEGRGRVIARNLLKQTYIIKTEDGQQIEVGR